MASSLARPQPIAALRRVERSRARAHRSSATCDARSGSSSSASRRAVLVAPALLSALTRTTLAPDARASVPASPRVLVVGSTGATGRLTVAELAKSGKASAVVAGARSADKAKKLGLDAVATEVLGGVDVSKDAADLEKQFAGFDVVVVCTGFVPGNPLKMNAAAHEVDNLGVKKVADAAKAAGVKRVVLISSILTNGPGMGAADTAGYKITNAFGRVLEEKLEGENYLRASGVPWVIVRPAGLKNDEPKASLVLAGEDVMTSGEISRALVAKVMAYAAFDDRCEGRVLEIAESGTFVGGDPANAKTFALSSDPATWFA